MTSLYDRHWQRRRAEQLRKHSLCFFCLTMDNRVTAATVADHITPHRGDPVLFKGPLDSLCAPCHSRRKQQLETTGRLRGCGLDGMPLDRGHHWWRPTAAEAAGALARLDATYPAASARSPAVGPPAAEQAPSGGANASEGDPTVDRPPASIRKGVNPTEKGS